MKLIYKILTEEGWNKVSQKIDHGLVDSFEFFTYRQHIVFYYLQNDQDYLIMVNEIVDGNVNMKFVKINKRLTVNDVIKRCKVKGKIVL